MTSEPIAFHNHWDGKSKSPFLFAHMLRSLGFYEDHFSGAPMGCHTQVPAEHWTKTYGSGAQAEWKSDFASLNNAATQHNAESLDQVVGYSESEGVQELFMDNFYLNQSSLVGVFPFTFDRQALSSQQPFKERELHLEMKRDSNPYLIRALLNAGFMGIYWQDEVIFTAQGTKESIDQLHSASLVYLVQQGGVRKGHIVKESIPDGGFAYFNMNFENMPHIIRGLIASP